MRLSCESPVPARSNLWLGSIGDLENGEFGIRGQIVADNALAGEPDCSSDGSITVKLEALTIAA